MSKAIVTTRQLASLVQRQSALSPLEAMRPVPMQRDFIVAIAAEALAARELAAYHEYEAARGAFSAAHYGYEAARDAETYDDAALVAARAAYAVADASLAAARAAYAAACDDLDAAQAAYDAAHIAALAAAPKGTK